VHKPLQFRLVSHAMVERFILPEGFTGPAQDEIGFSRRGFFQPAHDHGQRLFGHHQQMDVVGHDYPSPKPIEIHLTLAMLKGLGNHGCDSGIAQPDWSESGFVSFTFSGKEGFAVEVGRRKRLPHLAAGSVCGTQQAETPAPRQRAGKTPRYEKKGSSVTSGSQCGSFRR